MRRGLGTVRKQNDRGGKPKQRVKPRKVKVPSRRNQAENTPATSQAPTQVTHSKQLEDTHNQRCSTAAGELLQRKHFGKALGVQVNCRRRSGQNVGEITSKSKQKSYSADVKVVQYS
jgi:hypothetical protein